MKPDHCRSDWTPGTVRRQQCRPADSYLAHVAAESAEQLGMKEDRAQLSKIVGLLSMAGEEQERLLSPPAAGNESDGRARPVSAMSVDATGAALQTPSAAGVLSDSPGWRYAAEPSRPARRSTFGGNGRGRIPPGPAT